MYLIVISIFIHDAVRTISLQRNSKILRLGLRLTLRQRLRLIIMEREQHVYPQSRSMSLEYCNYDRLTGS
jgi:hypothetical protein